MAKVKRIKPIMNMKKLSIAAVVMMGFGVSGAQAIDGTLNFHGTVASTACSVAAGSEALVVPMDAVPISLVSALPGAAVTSANLQKSFSIKLETCPSVVENVSIKLTGKTSTGSGANVFVDSTSSGAAKYAGYVITDAQSGAVIPANVVTQYSTPLVVGNNNLNYRVGYAKTGANTPTAGPMVSVINYELSYL